MALFNVKIIVKQEHDTHIIVEADSHEEALVYTKTNNEWEEDGNISMNNEETYWTRKFHPVCARKVIDVSDLPKGWDKTSLPWPSDKPERTIEDFF